MLQLRPRDSRALQLSSEVDRREQELIQRRAIVLEASTFEVTTNRPHGAAVAGDLPAERQIADLVVRDADAVDRAPVAVDAAQFHR